MKEGSNNDQIFYFDNPIPHASIDPQRELKLYLSTSKWSVSLKHSLNRPAGVNTHSNCWYHGPVTDFINIHFCWIGLFDFMCYLTTLGGSIKKFSTNLVKLLLKSKVLCVSISNSQLYYCVLSTNMTQYILHMLIISARFFQVNLLFLKSITQFENQIIKTPGHGKNNVTMDW